VHVTWKHVAEVRKIRVYFASRVGQYRD